MRHLLHFILKYKFKNSIELIYLYIFFISSFFLVGLLSQGGEKGGISGMIWVVMLFTWMLGINQFWAEDEQDGTLDQWQVSGIALEWVALAKLLVQGVLVVAPVAILTGIGLQYAGIPHYEPYNAIAALMIAGTQMSAIGMLSAAISVGLQRANGIAGLVMLPLAVPSMLWGSAALVNASEKNNIFLMLGGYCLTSIVASCIASAASLRASS